MSILSDKIIELRKTGVDQKIINNIDQFIQSAPPEKLVQMSPFRLAMEWGVDDYETLEAFLHGTRLGIFDLEWDIKCPSCKAATMMSGKLDHLTPDSHCHYCNIDIKGGFDDAVEVTFRVNENVRFIGEIPMNVRIMNTNVFETGIEFSAKPGETVEKEIEVVDGTYHMQNLEHMIGAPLLIKGNAWFKPEAIEFVYEGGMLKRGSEYFPAGKYPIRLVNNSDKPLNLSFVHAKDLPWVSGATVATNQLFRDLFSTELISSDESFSIRSISFVFTDIKGSTAMYERLGDSRAYYLVKEHFKIMKKVIVQHHGSIVKTIGDAVMGTFMTSVDAVNVVFEMFEAFKKFNSEDLDRDDIIIKVGAHRGPCIAVTSNDKLDYFGQTVNIAARVQGLSTGDEIVLSESVYNETGIKNLIECSGWKPEFRKADLKGIEGLYSVVYLYPGG